MTVIAHYKLNENASGDLALPSGLIAHYTMDDNTNTSVVVDETGDHVGVYKDAGGEIDTDTGDQTGIIDNALDFGFANSEYVEITDHADFTPILTPFSISAWIKMDDALTFAIASKYDTAGTLREWAFGCLGDGKLAFLIFDENADKHIARLYNTVITSYEGSWIHVMGTYDGGNTDASIKVYLNGMSIGDTSAGSGNFVTCQNTVTAVTIGRFDANYANGLIDNVMFFSKELSLTEVQGLYNACIVRDSSGNEHHGGLLQENTASAHVVGAGHVNGAFDFNGSSDHIEIGTSPFYAESAIKMSVSLWAYVDISTFDADIKMLLNSSTGSPGSNKGFYIGVDDRGGGSSPLNGVQFSVGTVSGYEGVRTNDNVFSSVRWYHIVATYGNNAGKIYINGVDVSNRIYNGSGNFVPRNYKLYIGASNNDSAFYNGLIDNVIFFNQELNLDEVKALYHGGHGTEIVEVIDLDRRIQRRQ